MVFSWRVVLGLIDKTTKLRFFIFVCWLCSEYVELLWGSICAATMGIYGHFVKEVVWLPRKDTPRMTLSRPIVPLEHQFAHLQSEGSRAASCRAFQLCEDLSGVCEFCMQMCVGQESPLYFSFFWAVLGTETRALYMLTADTKPLCHTPQPFMGFCTESLLPRPSSTWTTFQDC